MPDELVRDQPDQDDRAQGDAGGEDMQDPVADPIASPGSPRMSIAGTGSYPITWQARPVTPEI